MPTAFAMDPRAYRVANVSAGSVEAAIDRARKVFADTFIFFLLEEGQAETYVLQDVLRLGSYRFDVTPEDIIRELFRQGWLAEHALRGMVLQRQFPAREK